MVYVQSKDKKSIIMSQPISPEKMFLARMFHESLAATTDLAALPGVLACRSLRRTVQVRKSPPCGCPVARPPRLSEQARDGGQARPSPRSRYSNS